LIILGSLIGLLTWLFIRLAAISKVAPLTTTPPAANQGEKP
jgi:hypothetical protein